MDQSKYLPLYLKHRPQTLGELVGQKSVVKTLTNAIENNRIAHAYLFTGPRGTGKTSSARILAKSINCEKGPTVTPCLECASCLSIKDSSCPSVFEIDAASNNSVDDARMLIERAPLVAQGGRSKLYIIDECHMLTKEAFNALLKTIEEPPPNVIFILATTEEHKVPPTILSRCQRLMFRLVNHEELAEHLVSVAAKENIEIEKDALELITRKSGGGLRDALGLLDQASLLSRPGEPVSQKDLLVLLGALDEDVLLTLSKGILERNGKAVLDAITGLVMQGREPALIAQEMAKHFLNLAKASYIATKDGNASEAGRFVLGSTTYIEGLIAQATSFERVELTQMVEQLDNLEQSLKRSTQPSMTLEIALLSLCHRHDITSVRDLEEKVAKLEELISQGDFSTSHARRPGPEPQQTRPSYAAPQGQSTVAQRYDGQAPGPSAQAPRYDAPPSGSASASPRAESAPGFGTPASSPGPQVPPTANIPPVAVQAVDQNRSESAISDSSAQQSKQEPAKIDSEEDDENGTPDVVVSSVQTLPALPEPNRASAYSQDDSEEEEDYGDSPVSVNTAQETASPVDQVNAAPAREHVAQSPSASASEGGIPLSALEQLWSDLLDALHKRSIPAFSLVSMHAFPVRFESNTLTIGVQREFFQKSIENKTNNIIVAYKDLRNEDIRVLVKVISDGGPTKNDNERRPAPNPSQGNNSAPMQSRPEETTGLPGKSHAAAESNQNGSSANGSNVAHRAQQEAAHGRLSHEPATNDAHMTNRTPSATVTVARPQPGPESSGQQDPDSEGERGSQQKPSAASTPASSSQHGPVRESVDRTLIEPSLDSSKIQEAYKIFEGPGSRLIS